MVRTTACLLVCLALAMLALFRCIDDGFYFVRASSAPLFSFFFFWPPLSTWRHFLLWSWKSQQALRDERLEVFWDAWARGLSVLLRLMPLISIYPTVSDYRLWLAGAPVTNAHFHFGESFGLAC
jgi:hypothetical protein